MPPLYGISSQQTRRVLTPALRVAKRNFRTTGGETPSACKKFYLINRRRTPKPALCKGRCRAERGGGVVPDTNYLFLFCSATSTLLQSLRRCRASSLYTREPFCANIARNTLHTAGATIGRPPESPHPGGGWRRQAAGGERATKDFVFVLDTARQTLGATTV